MLTEPHRLELLTHCYRMLGSLEDAEDQVQETFLKAWRHMDTYEGRASIRAWLYKIATNTCLDALKNHPKRKLTPGINLPVDFPASFPPSVDRSKWIEPFPEDWLSPTESSPEARYEAHEAVSLAFLVALHVLPPRQRSVLILSDVLGWPMTEIADTMQTSLSSVTSLLHRARATMKQRKIAGMREAYRQSTPDHRTRLLLDRYMRAWESADIEGIVSLLTRDATFIMPPYSVLVQGRVFIQDFINKTIFQGKAHNHWKLLPIRASGQLGYAFYQFDEVNQAYRPFALHILAFDNDLISEAVTFGLPSLFRFFNLPDALTI